MDFDCRRQVAIGNAVNMRHRIVQRTQQNALQQDPHSAQHDGDQYQHHDRHAERLVIIFLALDQTLFSSLPVTGQPAVVGLFIRILITLRRLRDGRLQIAPGEKPM